MAGRRTALAASLALFAGLLAGLVGAPSASADPPVTLTGILLVAHEDDFTSHRSRPAEATFTDPAGLKITHRAGTLTSPTTVDVTFPAKGNRK